MKNYYDINYEAFINKHSKNEYIKDDGDECNVVLYTDAKGMDVLAIKDGEYDRLIGSQYDNEYFINTWVESTKLKSFASVIFVFGLGEINCIRQLAKKFPDNDILVYEPRNEYFKAIMETYDITDIINNERIEILAGKMGMAYFVGMCDVKIGITNGNYLVYKIMPQYDKIYREELTKWQKEIQEALNRILLDKNFTKRFGVSVIDNVMRNLHKAITSCTIKDIANEINNEKNNCAVLVSAGPSLSKNIHLLKEVKNKAFIIVVDTAVKPVLKAGVVPDMIVTIDPEKAIELFTYEEKIVNIPMVTVLQANSNVVENYPAKIFFSYNHDIFYSRLYDGDDYLQIVLNTGGSVANNAMSFLMECGFKDIILIGQDLAWSDNRTHVSGAYEDDEKITTKSDERYMEVKGINGDIVLTRGDMDHYRLWFQNVIRANPQINLIDATEGGALIEGSNVMTFAEAIKEYVESSPCINYEEIIANVCEPTEEMIEAKLEKIYSFDEEILNTKKDINKTLRLYDELDSINRKGNYGSKRLKTLTAEISENTNSIKESVLVALLSYNKSKDEYEILQNINENYDNLYDEFKSIIDSGRKTLNQYLDNLDDILELIRKTQDDIRQKEEIRKG